MSVVRPPGSHGHGSVGPQTRGEEVFGDIVVGLIATAVGALFTLVACGALTYGAVGALRWVGDVTGLHQAWIALVQISAAGPLTAEHVASLVWQNVLFGAAAGAVVGLARFARRWRADRHRWLVEAVISPSGLAAVGYGATCLALHILISGLVAWAAGALFGVFLPSPAALLGGEDAHLVIQVLASGGGGDGGGPAELVGRSLYLLVFLVLVASAAACVLYAAAAWVLFRLAPSGVRVAGEGAVAGGAAGVGALAVAILLQCAITRYGVKKDGWGSSEGNAGRAVSDLREAGTSFFHAFLTAALSGGAQALLYAAAVIVLPMVFGVVATPK